MKIVVGKNEKEVVAWFRKQVGKVDRERGQSEIKACERNWKR